MKMTFILPSLLVLTSATGVAAQGFTGGSVDLTYESYSDVDELTSTIIGTSLQFALSPQFSIALDVEHREYDDIGFTLPSTTAHAIYNVNSDIAVGGYYSRENVPGANVEGYGAEVSYDIGQIGLGAYAGVNDVVGTDINRFGASASYAFGNGASVMGDYQFAAVDGGTDISVIEIGGAYALASGVSLSAAVGSLTADGSGIDLDETYYQIGVSVSFGPDGGTTFENRGIFSVLPIILF